MEMVKRNNSQDPVTVSIKDLNVSFGNQDILMGISLNLLKGEKFGIVGPSGVGKTTILNAIAGTLLELSNVTVEGDIKINGFRSMFLPAYKRNVGMVFQNLALFPHMTVAQNLAFPLKVRKKSRNEIEGRIDRFLELLQLTEKKHSSVEDISGGQRQRVALGRALIYEPSLLLMDEPVKGLDPGLKEKILDELSRLQDMLNFTLIYVTHDQHEAFRVCEKVAVLNNGRFLQVGSPKELYCEPVDPFVARFIGRSNWIQSSIVRTNSDVKCNLFNKEFPLPLKQYLEIKPGKHSGFVWIRPEYIQLIEQTAGLRESPENIIYKGSIVDSKFIGGQYEYQLDIGQDNFLFAISPNKINRSQKVFIRIQLDQTRWFDEQPVQNNN